MCSAVSYSRVVFVLFAMQRGTVRRCVCVVCVAERECRAVCVLFAVLIESFWRCVFCLRCRVNYRAGFHLFAVQIETLMRRVFCVQCS